MTITTVKDTCDVIWLGAAGPSGSLEFGCLKTPAKT